MTCSKFIDQNRKRRTRVHHKLQLDVRWLYFLRCFKKKSLEPQPPHSLIQFPSSFLPPIHTHIYIYIFHSVSIGLFHHCPLLLFSLQFHQQWRLILPRKPKKHSSTTTLNSPSIFTPKQSILALKTPISSPIELRPISSSTISPVNILSLPLHILIHLIYSRVCFLYCIVCCFCQS